MFQRSRDSSTLSHLLSGIGHYSDGIRGRDSTTCCPSCNHSQVAGGSPRWQVAGNLPSVIHSVLHPALNSALCSADPHFPENSFTAAFLNSPWA